MQTGKVPENIWKRSIIRQLKTQREEVMYGAVWGEDCAILALKDKEALFSVAQFTFHGPDMALYGIHGAVNQLAARGSRPVAVLLEILFPAASDEEELKAVMAQAEAVSASLNIQVARAQAEVMPAVNCPILTVTAVGEAKRGEVTSLKGVRPGADVVMTKWVGTGGASLLARKWEERLLSRFPSRLVEEAKRFDRHLSIIPEAAVAVKSGVCAMTGAGEGGIFGALWEMGEHAGVGLEIDLKKLSIRQETVEICNELDLNPYELMSMGCLVAAASNGNDLVRSLEAEGISAAVVGKVTSGKDRVVYNGAERRFLTPTKMDELYRLC